jgi:hypothetical protein
MLIGQVSNNIKQSLVPTQEMMVTNPLGKSIISVVDNSANQMDDRASISSAVSNTAQDPSSFKYSASSDAKCSLNYYNDLKTTPDVLVVTDDEKLLKDGIYVEDAVNEATSDHAKKGTDGKYLDYEDSETALVLDYERQQLGHKDYTTSQKIGTDGELKSFSFTESYIGLDGETYSDTYDYSIDNQGKKHFTLTQSSGETDGTNSEIAEYRSTHVMKDASNYNLNKPDSVKVDDLTASND